MLFLFLQRRYVQPVNIVPTAKNHPFTTILHTGMESALTLLENSDRVPNRDYILEQKGERKVNIKQYADVKRSYPFETKTIMGVRKKSTKISSE